ncbi:YadA C-terminal domain-containing protein [Acinetobacter towneri]|uniref:YadA C-terminal domain-containing protein n=1 Tax=Acinetobacter towneri TaxID=202956 RepID=UPI001CE050C8|nr:YadA C-terminal domain-containing protein [Acinetobacter towneri]MCA4787843.1 YadA-like family protein [Acinetobacter towneri]MCA4812553.1 YadA-like family protein [Acinetobacter towneri]
MKLNTAFKLSALAAALSVSVPALAAVQINGNNNGYPIGGSYGIPALTATGSGNGITLNGSTNVVNGSLSVGGTNVMDAIAAKANASDLAAKANASDLAAKANASDLAALGTVVDGKANASDLAALGTVVDGKANASDLAALGTVVDGKANASDLAAEILARTQGDTDIRDEIAAGITTGSLEVNGPVNVYTTEDDVNFNIVNGNFNVNAVNSEEVQVTPTQQGSTFEVDTLGAPDTTIQIEYTDSYTRGVEQSETTQVYTSEKLEFNSQTIRVDQERTVNKTAQAVYDENGEFVGVNNVTTVDDTEYQNVDNGKLLSQDQIIVGRENAGDLNALTIRSTTLDANDQPQTTETKVTATGISTDAITLAGEDLATTLADESARVDAAIAAGDEETLADAKDYTDTTATTLREEADAESARLDGRVDTVEASVTALDSKVDTEVARLDGRVDTVEASVTALDSKVDTEVARLDGRVDTVEASVTALDSKVDTEVARLDGRVDTVEASVTALDSKVDTEVNRLDGRVDTVESSVTALDSKVDTEVARLDSDIANANAAATAYTDSTAQTLRDEAAAESARVNTAIVDGDAATLAAANATTASTAATLRGEAAAESARLDQAIVDGDAATLAAANATTASTAQTLRSEAAAESARVNTAIVDGDAATLASANAYTNTQVANVNSRVNQLNSRVDDVEKTSYRGIAIALAAQQQIPNIGAGQFAVFGGVGHYEGESAGALGVASVFADGRTSVSAALGFAGGNEVGGRVGVSYVFGGK